MFTRLRGMVNTVSNQIVTNDGEERPDNGENMPPEEYTAGHEQGLPPHTPEELGTDQPDLGELSAAAEQFNTAFNTALYELESSRKLISERSAKIEELNDSIGTLSNRLAEESNNSRMKDEAHTQEKEQLQQRLHAAESECGRLQQQASEQEATLQARIEEAGQLTQRVEELNRSLEEQVAKGAQASEEFAREKEALSNSLAELQHKYDSTCEELDGFSRKVGELTAEIASLREASELKDQSYSEETARLGSELHASKQTVESLESTNRELTEHVEKLQGLNRALHESAITESNLYKKTLDERGEELEVLRARLASASDTTDGMPSADEETQQLQHALQQLESRLQQAEEQREVHAARANAAVELEAEVTRLNCALEEAGKQNVESEQLHAAQEQASRLEAEVERLNVALQEASKADIEAEQLHGAQQEISRLEAEVERLQAALQEAGESSTGEADHHEQLQTLQQQVSELEAKLQQAHDERSALDEKLASHEMLEQEIASLKLAAEESDSKLHEQASSNVDVDALQSEIESLKSALATAEGKCVQLQTAVDDKPAEAVTSPAMELSLEPRDEEAATPVESAEKATGRDQFIKTLGEELTQPFDGSTKATVIYVLMDNFIRIRDEIGIMNSEHVMTEVQNIISSNCEGDMITRFGDCTFAVLCKNTDIDTTKDKAQKIRVAVEGHIFDIAGQSLVTTTSIGIAAVRENDSDAEKVIGRADLACESARTSGGNQVLVSSTSVEDLDIPGNNEGHAETVHNVLDEGRIKIYYQPITSLKGNASHCYEVLTRIIDEDGNIILPGEFFSMAVNSGLAMDVDQHVIENIMRMMAGNPDQPMLLFLKLTRQTVASEDFPVWLMDKVKEHKINPEQLVFEVAESLVQNELKKLSMLSKALASIGCKMAIEHYRMDTQPQHLQHIQADYLKIDSGLVQNISNKGKCFTKVTEIMEVARSNNFISIAEGVESPATLAILWELGVSLAQGYFIQSPVGNMEAEEDNAEQESEETNSNKATFNVM